MEAEGYTVTECRDASGTVHAPHDHNEDQTIWVTSGSFQICIGDEQYTLNAGDRDYLPAHTEHSALASSESAVVYLIGAKT